MTSVQSNIELVDIHKELGRLWDEHQGKDRVLARLFTFIIYTKKSQRTPYYQELINQVIAKFPSRIIVIIEDQEAHSNYLRTSVSSKSIGEGAEQIFCEQIQIEGGGDLCERIPYIILPHIVPDLPLYLFWTRHLMEKNPIFSMLERFADRIIFDSEAALDLNHFSKTILSFLGQFHCDIGDLNWAALSGWRKIFSSAFNSPEAMEHLESIHHFRITYNKNPTKFFQHNEVKAAYLQAWMAATLNWKFKSIEEAEGNTRITYTRLGGEVVVILSPAKQESLPPGSLLSVEIESLARNGHYVFKRQSESRQVFIQFSDDKHCDLPYCSFLSGFSPGEEVVEEIFYGQKSVHYENMLKVLADIPWTTTKEFG